MDELQPLCRHWESHIALHPSYLPSLGLFWPISWARFRFGQGAVPRVREKRNSGETGNTAVLRAGEASAPDKRVRSGGRGQARAAGKAVRRAEAGQADSWNGGELMSGIGVPVI